MFHRMLIVASVLLFGGVAGAHGEKVELGRVAPVSEVVFEESEVEAFTVTELVMEELVFTVQVEEIAFEPEVITGTARQAVALAQ
jgi:hypothetical protein